MRTSKACAEWWDAQPDAQICSDCGKTGHKAYIQPQWPGFWKHTPEADRPAALCGNCIGLRNELARRNRKRQLDAMPRCEVPACNRRGSWKVGTCGALLCGAHKKALFRAFVGSPVWLPMPQLSREDVIRIAGKGN